MARESRVNELVIVAVLTIIGALLRTTRIGGSTGGDEFFTAAMMELPLQTSSVAIPRSVWNLSSGQISPRCCTT